MKRGDIYWASFEGPAGRRPVLIVTRDPALRFLTAITVAPISRTLRDAPSQVRLGRRNGLNSPSFANCDSMVTVDRAILDLEPMGKLRPADVRALDRALVFALGIRC